MTLKQVGILIPIENIVVANEAAMMLTGIHEDINTFSVKHLVYREHDNAAFSFALGTFDDNAYSQLSPIMKILEGIYFDTDQVEFMFQCMDRGFTFKH